MAPSKTASGSLFLRKVERKGRTRPFHPRTRLGGERNTDPPESHNTGAAEGSTPVKKKSCRLLSPGNP